MPNTYSKLCTQIIFAVKGRSNFLQSEWREEIYKYISGIVDGKSQKLYAIGGMPDHIHLLIGYNPTVTISDLVRDIKSNSSAFVNRKIFKDTKFQWQSGFGAFSYGQSQISDVIRYIENQEDHHKHRTFKEEYIQFLNRYQIEYNIDYLFEFYT
ncbi:MAG: IS200/IS605 family transposase [Bacteroidetes bacterium]|jgi:REP element-mobilizing transposase RayT|nr:IS200/IS605 family transposase [Bacteroidota bacterium]